MFIFLMKIFNPAIFSLFISAVFESMRNILHNADTDKRIQYMMEVMFAVQKDGFKVSNVFLLLKN